MYLESPAPPEAVLIRRAREAVTPKLTAAAAAHRARAAGGKISDPYWRNIETGYGGRRGKRVPMRASDETLALMAATITAAGVPVTPQQLEDAGRAGAAAALRATTARRLGDLLQSHRISDRPDSRPVFCTNRGISHALALDVEHGHRATLTPADIAVISRAYQVTAASVAAVFAGTATVLESLPDADDDEVTIWAVVNQHPPGTPGMVLFPGSHPGEVTQEAQRWDALAPLTSVQDLVKVTAFWRRTDRLDAGQDERERAAS